MKPKHILTNLALFLPALLACLIIAACDSSNPTPTPVPTTATAIPGTPTSAASPTQTTTPTETSTPTTTPTVTSTPTETPQPTIVSVPASQPTTVVQQGAKDAQQQYNAALAKWRSQNVVEYIEVVKNVSQSPFAGVWTLHVNGDKVDIIGYSTLDKGVPATPSELATGDSLKFVTVQALFDSISYRLSGGDFGGVLENRDVYVVTYDPTFGYPSSVQVVPRPGTRNDFTNGTTIQKLTILKRWPIPASPTPRPTPQPPTPTITATSRPAPSPTSVVVPTRPNSVPARPGRTDTVIPPAPSASGTAGPQP